MANFLKSLFFGETDESEETKLNRNFDVLKYDGIKAVSYTHLKNTGRMRLADPSNKNPVSFVLWPHHTILPHTPFLSPVFVTVQ